MLNGGNVEMIVKITGVKPEAITPLHTIAQGELKENSEGLMDRNNGLQRIYLVKVLNTKFDEFHGTYTVELKIMLRCGAAMSGPGKGGRTRFGAYFTPISVFEQLFKTLSIGQEQNFFPAEFILAEKD